MKKILNFLWTITLIGTITISLVACNNKNKTNEYTKEELEKLKQKNKIDTTDQTIKNNLEWIAPQEKPFNKIDDKYYFVIWRGNKDNKWDISKFYNSYGGSYYTIDEKSQIQVLFSKNEYFFGIKEFYEDKNKNKIIISKNNILNIIKEFEFYDINNDYIKYVYRWNLNTSEPNLEIDKNGNIKVKLY